MPGAARSRLAPILKALIGQPCQFRCSDWSNAHRGPRDPFLQYFAKNCLHHISVLEHWIVKSLSNDKDSAFK
jgi:hypothetical protein